MVFDDIFSQLVLAPDFEKFWLRLWRWWRGSGYMEEEGMRVGGECLWKLKREHKKSHSKFEY